jgi:hypothetical protein
VHEAVPHTYESILLLIRLNLSKGVLAVRLP